MRASAVTVCTPGVLCGASELSEAEKNERPTYLSEILADKSHSNPPPESVRVLYSDNIDKHAYNLVNLHFPWYCMGRRIGTLRWRLQSTYWDVRNV